jgi:hypothetical protein
MIVQNEYPYMSVFAHEASVAPRARRRLPRAPRVAAGRALPPW